MDAPLKELAKLEKLTLLQSNATASPIIQALDSLLQTFYATKEHISNGDIDENQLRQILHVVEMKKKEVDERQKEIYNSMSRFGKALDKVMIPKRCYCPPISLTPFESEILQCFTCISRLVYLSEL